MLHHVITFDEKWQNLPTWVISYKVIRDGKTFLTIYYEIKLDFFFKFFLKFFFTFLKILQHAKIVHLKKKKLHLFFKIKLF